MAKRYYWLKLKNDFFDDETIRFIEEQENGVKYSNFYLKLCLKSLQTDGRLIRLVGDTLIPYDIKSLANLTMVDIDTVHSAMILFQNIGLVKVLETGEIYLSQIEEMIGSETDKAQIMRRKRAEEKLIGNNVTGMLPKCYLEIEKDIELEKDIYSDIDIKERDRGKPHSHTNDNPKRKVFTPPTVEEVKQYCQERNNNVDAETFVDFYECKGWMVGKNKMKDWKAAVRTWERKDNYSRPKANTNKPTTTDHKDTKSAAMEIFGEF
jgi:predicted phage replisome organizer